MANLASTGVTVNRSFYAGGLQNKDYVQKNVTMVLASMGIATDGSRIPATALGLARIESAGLFVKSDNTMIYLGVPSADGDFLLMYLLTSTDGAPDAVTATVVGNVMGPPSATY